MSATGLDVFDKTPQGWTRCGPSSGPTGRWRPAQRAGGVCAKSQNTGSMPGNAAVLPRRRDFLSTGRYFSTWLPLGKHSPTIASRRRKGWGELPSTEEP
jgi:hypothetical protein